MTRTWRTEGCLLSKTTPQQHEDVQKESPLSRIHLQAPWWLLVGRKATAFLIWNQHRPHRPRCKSNKFNNPTDLPLPSPKVSLSKKIHPSIYQHNPHVINYWLKTSEDNGSKKNGKNMLKNQKNTSVMFCGWKWFFWEQTTLTLVFLQLLTGASAFGFSRLSIRPSQGWLKPGRVVCEKVFFMFKAIVKTTTTRDTTKYDILYHIN